METHRPEDWLESLLRQPGPEIDDHGFTARVMESLPPRRSAGRLRFLVLSGFALVACFLAFVLLPAGSFIWESLQQVSRLDITAVSLLGFLSFLGLTIGVAVSVATADA